jgi:hypothetical protein
MSQNDSLRLAQEFLGRIEELDDLLARVANICDRIEEFMHDDLTIEL